MSVFVSPGEIVFTRILVDPNSLERTFAKDLNAAFDDEYAERPIFPYSAAEEDKKIILPFFVF